MNFEEIQNSWLAQPVPEPDMKEILATAKTQWEKQHRKTLRNNVGVTVCFAAVLYVLGTIYISDHLEHSIFFSGSLVFMALLIVAYAIAMWKGIAYRQVDMSVATRQYLAGCVEKLLWRRKLITIYSRVYSVLLWLALMCYCIDVTKGGSMALRIGAPLSITVYILGVQIIVTRTKQKKQLKEIEELVSNMQQLKDGMPL